MTKGSRNDEGEVRTDRGVGLTGGARRVIYNVSGDIDYTCC